MKLQWFPSRTVVASIKNGFPLGDLTNTAQGAKFSNAEFISKLLGRKWILSDPAAKVNLIRLSATEVQSPASHFSLVKDSSPFCTMLEKEDDTPSFYVIRDDLLHPLINGNKARKLDGLLPLIEDHSVTDVVTCGGCQSAHTAATAVLCAERGLRSHLLLRGEQPEILTGYNLISTIYGNVTYIARSLYTNREKMLKKYAGLLAGNDGDVMCLSDIFEAPLMNQARHASNSVQMDSYNCAKNHPRKVAIINEGAGDAGAMLGLIRLVHYLSQDHLFGKQRAIKFVVDAGTGTTAVGLGLGALLLGLPWKVTAVILADTIDGYRKQEKGLISDFRRHFGLNFVDQSLNETDGGIVHWVERRRPRKFGNILEGEVQTCQNIAQRTGILVDPVYTLAAWEMATLLSQKADKATSDVVMLHTGGTLGMFGLAQRYKSYFHSLKDGSLVNM